MTKRNRSEGQRFNQPPKLNKKHSVTIRFGATHNSVELDGQVVDLGLRKGESPKDNAQRQERVRHDLIQQVFA